MHAIPSLTVSDRLVKVATLMNVVNLVNVADLRCVSET
jgi:hypothetical protein